MIRSDTARLPVPLLGALDDAPSETERDSGFAAQVLGQGGARRGLRGGEPVLRGARAAYLSTQWGGEDDRRPPSGLLRRVSV